jgi:hypothetical protein
VRGFFCGKGCSAQVVAGAINNRLRLDLPDAFGGYAELRGELVQGGAVLFPQPARLDNPATARIQRGQRLPQGLGAFPLGLLVFEHPARFVLGIGQVRNRRERLILALRQRFERDILAPHAGFHLDHFLALHVQLPRNRIRLVRRERGEAGFHAAQVEEQLALRLGSGDLDDAPVTQDKLMNLRPDPVDRERHQTHSSIRVKPPDRLHQADIALLDQVGVGKPVTHVASRDGNHQPQVRQHQLAGGIHVILLAQTRGKLDLLFLRQEREAVYGLDVGLQTACRGQWDCQCQRIRHFACSLVKTPTCEILALELWECQAARKFLAQLTGPPI